MLDRQQSVASVVLDHSECAAVFQQHRIDFCCGGQKSVEKAASDKGVDVDALLGELTRAIADRRGERPSDPRSLSTAKLLTHIVATHHRYLREALPFVTALSEKVGRVHGDHNPKLRELAVAVTVLSDALLRHLDDEERTLFPALISGNLDVEAERDIFVPMIDEHLAVARMLERVRAASDDFKQPDWACNSYRTLFAELQQLEDDVFKHVHLENNVLRPRFANS